MAFGYRSPREASALAAPALAVGAHRLALNSPEANGITLAAALLPVLLQFALLQILECGGAVGPQVTCSSI